MFLMEEINLQQFALEDGIQAIELFEWKDPESQKLIKIPVKIKTNTEEIDMKVIIGHLNSGIRKVVTREVKTKSENKLKELQTALAEKESSEAELQLKANSFEKEIHRLAGLFREAKIEKDILEAFLYYLQPDSETQVSEFKRKGSSLLKEENGIYRTVVRLKELKTELSPKEAVEHCFPHSLETNENEEVGGK